MHKNFHNPRSGLGPDYDTLAIEPDELYKSSTFKLYPSKQDLLPQV